MEKFEDIQGRNVKRVLFIVTPKNKNIERCVKIIYNDIKIIHSPESIANAISRFLSYETARKAMIEYRMLFLAEDKIKFAEEYEIFKKAYESNKVMAMLLEKNREEIEKLYDYNRGLRNLFYPYYTIRDLKQFLNKIKTKEPLCKNLNEVTEYCMDMVNSFEIGRNYSKNEWLEIIGTIYEDYEELGEYIND